MAEVIALVNQKGGVGKSTTAVNLGVGLAKYGRRVLIIDADRQGIATKMLGWQQPVELSQTLATRIKNYIRDLESPHNAVILYHDEGVLRHAEGIDLIPAGAELSLMETTLANTMNRHEVLKGVIQELRPHYDMILIDCAPSLGILTFNVLAAADSVVIPVQASPPAEGLEALLMMVGRVRKQINPNLKIGGILLTMAGQHNLSEDFRGLLRNTYGGQLTIYKTEIPYSIRVAEMSAIGKSMFDDEPIGEIDAAYMELIKEMLNRGKKIH